MTTITAIGDYTGIRSIAQYTDEKANATSYINVNEPKIFERHIDLYYIDILYNEPFTPEIAKLRADIKKYIIDIIFADYTDSKQMAMNSEIPSQKAADYSIENQRVMLEDIEIRNRGLAGLNTIFLTIDPLIFGAGFRFAPFQLLNYFGL